MTIQIKHSFTSLKGDGGDATLVRPSNWNAAHTTSMATGMIIGRLTAGAGAFEEIPISAYMANLLGSSDAAALAAVLGLFTTGDVKYTFVAGTAAPAGWISLSQASSTGRTIGNAASGANIRANADCLALYTLIYSNCSDTLAPVSGGRSGNATTDFNAGKTLTIPPVGSRSPIGAGGPGTGTSGCALGQTFGEENHTLTVAELAAHYHSAAIYDPSHVHNLSNNAIIVSGSGSGTGGGGAFGITQTVSALGNYTGVRVNSANGLDTTYSAGSSAGHNTYHPVIGLTALVKL